MKVKLSDLKEDAGFFTLFFASSAIPAGLAFVIEPGGELMQTQDIHYKLTLFDDFLIPGLVLLQVPDRRNCIQSGKDL